MVYPVKSVTLYKKRIDDNYRYKEDGSERQFDEYAEEYLNAYADAAVKGEFDGNMLRKAGNFIAGLFKRKGYNKIKFESGKDVKDFLTAYSKDVRKGKVGEKFTDLAAEGVEIDTDKLKESRARIKKTTKVNTPYEVINKMAEGVKTKSEWKESQGLKDAVAATEPGGVISNMILNQKMSPAKTAETIKSVRNRLMNFDPQAKRKAGSKEPITLAEFTMSNVKFGKLDASKVLFKESERAKMEGKDLDAKTSDGMDVIQVAAETDADVKAFEEQDMSMAAQAKRTKLAEKGKSESDQYSEFRKELGLDDKLVQKTRDTVVKTFGTKLPDVESKKFKAALQKAYRTELKKKPIQDMIGKGETYDTFLAEKFPSVYKFLPKETLLQMERNVAPENRIFTKSERITKPTEVDRLISEGLLPKNTNRLSGPTLITKLPYPGSKKS